VKIKFSKLAATAAAHLSPRQDVCVQDGGGGVDARDVVCVGTSGGCASSTKTRDGRLTFFFFGFFAISPANTRRRELFSVPTDCWERGTGRCIFHGPSQKYGALQKVLLSHTTVIFFC
jgi:hypothetical protein